MKKIFYVITVLAMAIALGGTAKATVISPPLIELEANRGDQLANTIKVKNDGTTAQTYYLSTQAFKAEGETGQPTFIDDTTDIVSWIKFAFDSITLQPGQTANIPFTINVPDTAASGGHYAAVFASTQPPTVTGSGVGVAARLGTLILVNVAGQTNESARIAEFSTDKDSYSMLPVDFTTRVENNGNVHIKPVGEIVVRNFWGGEATRLKLNEEGGNVLPNSIRRFDTIWGKDVKATGFFDRYKEEKNEHLFGKYTAELTMVYGEGKVAKSSVQFWVVPTERIIVDLILILLIILVLVFLIKRYNAWLITKYSSTTKTTTTTTPSGTMTMEKKDVTKMRK